MQKEPYLFQGVVLPERAQLTLQFDLRFSHIGSGLEGNARVSILLNQVAVWIESEDEWDIFDLRNVVKSIVQSHLAMLGYLKGYAYDFEIARVVSWNGQIDYVFGVDTPCLTVRSNAADLQNALAKLRNQATGLNGVFLHRCFGDLVSAMKHADDTAFYCYRAIESLRHHCSAVHGLSSAQKSLQWQKFREISGCGEQTLRDIKAAADPLRHGDVQGIDASDRTMLFTSTWDVVDGYLASVLPSAEDRV